MKFLHVITSVHSRGGGPIEGIMQLRGALKRFGHTAEIASLDPPGASWIAECPLKVHALGPGFKSYGYTRRMVPWLRAHHRDYDAVIVNGIWQYGSFATWRALRNTTTPYVVFTHGMLDPWFKETYPLKHLKKCLYWPWGEFRVLRDARAVCFTCEEERVLARQSFSPYRAREWVINYGISAPDGDPEMQREALFSKFPHLRDRKLILFLSRIHPKKGCDLAIEAFAKVAQRDESLHLVMAGPDQVGLQAQLQAQARALGIEERITWPGMLRGDLKWGAFRAADAFLLPSHQENFGIVVAEALACGAPVLISNKINIWREIESANAGLVAPDTLQGTTDLLCRWLEMPETEKQQMRDNTVRCFEAKFEVRHAAESLLKLFGPNSNGEAPKAESNGAPVGLKTPDLSVR